MKILKIVVSSIVSVSVAMSATLTLNNGWNLVAIPSSSTFDKSTISYESISTFDGTSPISSRFITNIENGKGYWIKSNGSSSIEYTENTSISIPTMKVGWNLVGLPAYTNITELDNAMAKSGYKYSSISTFDGTSPISSRFITNINEKKGYWIYISEITDPVTGEVETGPNVENQDDSITPPTFPTSFTN
jgi:hypothetical protein